MTIDGVTPAPLRLQRKPVAGPGTPSEATPVAQTQTQQPQSPPPAHPQSGYFPMPTPAPSPYVANAQSNAPPQQQYGSYYPPQFLASPPPQQWYGGPNYAAPSQATPPALYEMDSPPNNPAFHTFPAGGGAPSIPPKVFQPVQTFIAELEGSEPPVHGEGQNTAAKDPPATAVSDPKPRLTQESDVTDVVGSASLTDSTSDPPSKSPEVKLVEDPHQETTSDPSPAIVDSEGLIVVEKPPPPDHEGLILSDAVPGSVTNNSHPSHTQLPSTSPYPGSNTNLVHQWPWHPSLNGPNPQHAAPPDQPSPSPTSPAASLHLQHGTPAPHPAPAPYQPPATATPPPAGHPTSRPHSTSFPTAQSHSPSPSLQGSQTGTVATTSPPPPNLQQGPHVPAAPSYTPAAFPSKPNTFPTTATPSGHTYTGTLPASHPSAIPSTPSVTSSPHSFSAPPQQPTSKPARHSGASTSFGGFANSVFSKDTVKWSKKTASRFGGAIKTAATSAHAAATSAQTAASQAAALHRQKSFAAAQMKVSSGAQGPGGNQQPTTVPSGQSQPPSSAASTPAPIAAPTPPVYGQQATNPAQMGMNMAPVVMGYAASHGQGPPGWPSSTAAGPNMGNGIGNYGMPAQAGAGSQPGPPPPFQRSSLGTAVPGHSQVLAGQPPYPNQYQQPWFPGAPAPALANPGNVTNIPPIAGVATTPGGPAMQPSPPLPQTGTSSQTQSQGPQHQPTPPATSPSVAQETSPAQPEGPNTQIQHAQPEPSADDEVTGTEAVPGSPVPSDKTGIEPQTEESPQPSTVIPSSDTPDAVGRQTPKPDASHQRAESAETRVTASPGPGQVPEGHSVQPSQPQPQPSHPGASPAPVQAGEGQPPQPSTVQPPPGPYQGLGGAPTYPYTYGQHPQPQPSGYASLPGPSPATPGPAGVNQPMGGQPPPQYPYPGNVANQQHIWNPGSPPPGQATWGPPAAPVVGQGPPGQPTYAQQPWGQAPSQSWAPPHNGAPSYGPDPNSAAPQGLSFLQQPQYATAQQPPQYGMAQPPQPQPPGQQAAPWSAPNAAPYSAPVPNPAAANWLQQQQQPPPQWHTPAPQQPGWSPPPGPMQPMPPAPYPQTNNYSQLAGAWDPNARQPQPWAQPQPWSPPQ